MKDDDAVIYVNRSAVQNMPRCKADFRRDTELLPPNLVDMLHQKLRNQAGIQSNATLCLQWTRTTLVY